MVAFFDEIIGGSNKKVVKIPYNKSQLTLEIDNPKAILTAKMHGLVPDKTPEEIITDALRNPIDSLPLCKLAEGKQVITIITSDHTRAVPSKITLPIILAELRKGNPNADIRIIIATGLHRATTALEQRAMFGDEIVDNEKIFINDANASQFVDLGGLPSGAGCEVNKLAVECDLLISEGFIEPHFFAGFSGGRKSVLPGISSKESINENHCFKAIAHPLSTTGVLKDNPVHQDMLVAAEKAKLAFILNVALNSKKQVLAAFAGDMHSAHAKGVEYVTECSVCEKVLGDIVITSNGGYPLDQNLYQTPKAMSTAALCAKPGGVIIMCAGCADGVGGENFERIMLSGDPAEIENSLSKIPPKETIPEMWNAQVLLRILLKHKVILVSDMSAEIISKMNMIAAESLAEALTLAKKLKGEDAEIVVIPDGVTVLCKDCILTPMP
ncbi:MAG: nickel-dependent lactate racemase [Clostridia bacterium]|nr:nickel-dependent lactate racemase [Clostridia bacterium]